jgi:hypothetical protein
VKDQASLDAALKDGWCKSVPEAIKQKLGTKTLPTTVIKTTPVIAPTPDLEVLGDNIPPTRAELENQATELGIKFTKKTTDDELNAKIDESLRN